MDIPPEEFFAQLGSLEAEIHAMKTARHELTVKINDLDNKTRKMKTEYYNRGTE